MRVKLTSILCVSLCLAACGGGQKPAEEPAADSTGRAKPETAQSLCVDAVRAVLTTQHQPVNIDELDRLLTEAGHSFSVRAVRDALKKLRAEGEVYSDESVRPHRHELTPQARERLELLSAEAA